MCVCALSCLAGFKCDKLTNLIFNVLIKCLHKIKVHKKSVILRFKSIKLGNPSFRTTLIIYLEADLTWASLQACFDSTEEQWETEL